MCHWPVGPTAPRSSPGWEESEFGWRKELGEALVRCPQRPLVVRPEGRREAGKVQIPVDLGGGWEKRIREGNFRHLRNPTNRMSGSVSTAVFDLHTALLTHDWFRHFSAEWHPFPPHGSHYKRKQTERTLLKSWLWHHRTLKREEFFSWKSTTDQNSELTDRHGHSVTFMASSVLRSQADSEQNRAWRPCWEQWPWHHWGHRYRKGADSGVHIS